MARKKFTKAATGASAPAPLNAEPTAAVTAPLSTLNITIGTETLSLPLPMNRTWADIEADLKPWLSGKTGKEIQISYNSAPLRGRVVMTHSRRFEPPFSPAEMLSFTREFAWRELLEIYGETPAPSKTSPTPDQS